jgi:hypothetical protein
MTCGSQGGSLHNISKAAGEQKKKEIAKNQRVKKNPRKETFIVHRG